MAKAFCVSPKSTRAALDHSHGPLAAFARPMLIFINHGAPVAQLDRASGYEPEGREFESPRAHHFESSPVNLKWIARTRFNKRMTQTRESRKFYDGEGFIKTVVLVSFPWLFDGLATPLFSVKSKYLMFELGSIIAIVIRHFIPPRDSNRHLFLLLGIVLVVVLVQYLFGWL